METTAVLEGFGVRVLGLGFEVWKIPLGFRDEVFGRVAVDGQVPPFFFFTTRDLKMRNPRVYGPYGDP